MNHHRSERGFVLITTVMLAGLLLSLLAAYWSVSNLETGTVRFSRANSSSFYAAEAGLNLRADQIRQVFVGFNRPSGASPTTASPCTGGNNGTGDFSCANYSFNRRAVRTYIDEDAGNPTILTIPPGERYQNLNAQEYRYTATSNAINLSGETEMSLGLRFKARLVPLFQFAAFYNKDLEILPGRDMSLSGPVHTNGDLYLYGNAASLTVNGQITAVGDVWRGRKDGSVTPSCSNSPVSVYDPAAPRSLIPSCSSRYKTLQSDLNPFNGMIQRNVQMLTVPEPEVFDPTPGRVYWDRADLRLVLTVDASNNSTGIQVRNAADTNIASQTTTLTNCPGVAPGSKAVGSTTIFNFRENKTIRLLDVDVRGMLECLKTSNWFGTGKQLTDTTDGGLVFHLTVKGPNSAAAANSYGVRLRNAGQLRPTSGSPAAVGMTVVSDQAIYLFGDYNAVNKIPAAVMADSLNMLSNNWSDGNSGSAIGSRVVNATMTVNSAFVAGTDTTGGQEGPAGQNGAYNGGLENYPRFHENWNNNTLVYRGSFVSLGATRHVNGGWGAQSYSPPRRDWNYDTSFNNAANLPPITPRFVYLRQELFVRDFDGQ